MYDLREIHEVIDIVGGFDQTPSPAALSKLRQLPKGSQRADNDTLTHPRNVQYELALYGLLKGAGIPAELGEPDLSVSFSGRTIPIQAKRPGSAARLDDNIRDAARQLNVSGEPGIIAVSLDQVIRPRKHFFTVDSHTDAADLLHRLSNDFIEEHITQIHQRVAQKPVAALMFTTIAPGHCPSTGMIITGQSYQMRLVVPDDSEMGVLIADLSAALDSSL